MLSRARRAILLADRQGKLAAMTKSQALRRFDLNGTFSPPTRSFASW